MVTPLVFFSQPAVHPRLEQEDTRDTLRDAWTSGGSIRIADALVPGLAAELCLFARSAPTEPRMFAEQLDVSTSCDVFVGRTPDPQHPECIYRASRFLETDLPALVSHITGRRLATIEPTRLHVWKLGKGSHVDQGGSLAPPGGVDVFLGLTGGSWPASMGGYLELLDEQGQLTERRAPGWDTLDIIDGQPWRMSLVTRHVEALMLRVALAPVEDE